MGDHPIGDIATGFQQGQASLNGWMVKASMAGQQQGDERPCRQAVTTGRQAHGANYHWRQMVIHAMRSTITSRGQTVVPALIRERFRLGPSTRLEWIVESDGSIRVVPVDADPITAFRGSGGGGGSERLLEDRRHDRERER